MNLLLLGLGGAALGAAIGYCFGLIQDAAAMRHARLQAQGRFSNGWRAMPGSFRRVAYLLVALAGVQFLCPFLFDGKIAWCVSGGLAAGYAVVLCRQLRRRRAGALA